MGWAYCGHGVGLLWAWSGHDVGMDWACCGHVLGLLWAWTGPDVGLLWALIGPTLGKDWVCCGHGPSSQWGMGHNQWNTNFVRSLSLSNVCPEFVQWADSSPEFVQGLSKVCLGFILVGQGVGSGRAVGREPWPIFKR